MKKQILSSVLLLPLLFSWSIQSIEAASITIVWGETTSIQDQITRADIFNRFTQSFKNEIPESYQYIQLLFEDVKKWTEVYSSLQQLVYLNLIKNTASKIHPEKTMDVYTFLKIAEKIYGMDFVRDDQIETLQSREVKESDLLQLDYRLNTSLNNFKNIGSSKEVLKKKAIFVDAYNILLSEYIDNENIDENKALDAAIEWITSSIWDKHTVYFPAIESKGFQDSLNGEYEWIWAYVDMEQPWAVRITSPIKWSPSEKAGIKGGDLVIKVDGKQVEKENSLKEVISWIKGPAGTKVRLTIDRDGTIFDVDVIRDTIVIKDIEYKLLDNNTFYIEIKSFWDHVSENFEEALKTMKQYNNIQKVIIDLRSNGWWYLWEVTDMLSHFIEKDLPTAHVKYKDNQKTFYSKGYNLIDFSKYDLVLLQNSWTASASEIMIGTLKDYYPDAEIIWEKSYGKGSVQTMRNYSDGSMLKYTIAKWYTWGSESGIDGIGIIPTIELEFDAEQYRKFDIDNQLNEARIIK